MDLLQNPFHILNASSRDNRRRIMELAEERSLLFDPNKCMYARSELTNPRKRLSAEVAWLPGIRPKRADEVLTLIESSPTDLLGIDKLTSVARANLLAAALSRLPDCSSADIAEWILEIAWTFEDIDAEELCVILNEERIVSGFPEITDLSAVEAEIQERRHYYRQVVKLALDNLSARNLVKAVTIAIESATDDGENQGPILIDDLVDSYEVEAQVFLEKEEENIKVLVKKIQTAVDAELPDSTLAPMINQLIQVVKNWDTVAQPIQVSTKSRGLDHDASRRVAGLVRGLAIRMFNEHGKLDFSQQLTNMLQEVFAEVVEVAERTAEDANTLGEIAEQRGRLMDDAKKQDEEWQESIAINIDFGIMFKKKLIISPDGIKWGTHLTPLDEVTRIRWGVINGSTYSISYGTDKNLFHLKMENGGLFSKITASLWRATGVRILTELLEGLRDGKKYRFGSAVVSDYGMDLKSKKTFASNERIFCRWGELVIWDGADVFCIGKKGDKKVSATFSYQNEDNIHVLEAAIRMFWKQGGDRLSSLLRK